jgi:hypothetical protein
MCSRQGGAQSEFRAWIAYVRQVFYSRLAGSPCDVSYCEEWARGDGCYASWTLAGFLVPDIQSNTR